MTVSIVIPAYNEAKNLGRVISDVRAAGWNDILVVDDGSTDDTSEVARQQKVDIISLEHNSGQGKALQSGIEHLKNNQNPDIIVTFDADGQHRPEDVKSLIQALEKGNIDAALGSRFLENSSQIPFFKKALLKCAVFYTRWTTGLNITDTHNGLRALTRKAYQTINLTWPRRAHASQILHQIARAKLRYVEVPVTILYN
ncbi:MAG: glycosyltransferase family 2 protein [Patescibacteria group bacterium]